MSMGDTDTQAPTPVVAKAWNQQLDLDLQPVPDDVAVNILSKYRRPASAVLIAKGEALTRKASEIMVKKNHDYTGGAGDPYANFRMAEQFGIHPVVGILLRMGDKMQRIRTFVERGELQVDGEGLEDACLDLINYAKLAYGLATEAKEEPDA